MLSHVFELQRVQDPKLRVAFVGCGNIASYHVKAAFATARVEVTALVDPVAGQRQNVLHLITQQQERGVEQFDSLTSALEADPDCALFEACVIMVNLHQSVPP